MADTNRFDQLTVRRFQSTVDSMLHILNKMSPAEICYAYKLLNHLCESTMELLVNKLIRNQVEYLLNNEVNKQLFNWIHLTLSTSCAKNEAIPVVNTSKSEHNSVLQFYETSPTVTEEESKTNNAVLSRSMSSDSCPMDLSQKVSSSSHFDRSRELINNDSSRLANVQRRNEYNCGTQKNDRRQSQTEIIMKTPNQMTSLIQLIILMLLMT
ncbi:unnamed protein product [Heterobilharzia americana]|nr:unnamed protein product [Heterobilharzia americana]